MPTLLILSYVKLAKKLTKMFCFVLFFSYSYFRCTSVKVEVAVGLFRNWRLSLEKVTCVLIIPYPTLWEKDQAYFSLTSCLLEGTSGHWGSLLSIHRVCDYTVSGVSLKPEKSLLTGWSSLKYTDQHSSLYILQQQLEITIRWGVTGHEKKWRWWQFRWAGDKT